MSHWEIEEGLELLLRIFVRARVVFYRTFDNRFWSDQHYENMVYSRTKIVKKQSDYMGSADTDVDWKTNVKIRNNV